MKDDQLPQTTDEPQVLGPLAEKVRAFVDNSVSENTRRAYRSDWKHFRDWCVAHEVSPVPAGPETVASYLAAMASGAARPSGDRYTASTIQRRLTALRVLHRAQGHDDPTDSELVQKTWKGIRRDDDVQVTQVGREALLTPHIRQMVDEVDCDSLKGLRDRAIILLGFATGARRSELAALDVEDLDFRPEGVVVSIRSSKSDQEGVGRTPSVHHGSEYCPVRAVKEWIGAAEIESGALFRSVDRWGNIRGNRLTGTSINRIVKAAAESAGLDSSRIGAHSLRAGHVTQRKVVGDSNDAIMDQTGHSSQSTMRRYDRKAKEFRHDVSDSLGL